METLALVGMLVAGFGSVWWRLGRLEGRMNGAMREWQSLKAKCPLCSVEKERDS